MTWLWRNSALKRALLGAMLCLYLSCSLGILPSPDLLSRWFGHVVSEPFPCQSHSCGCVSAEQCWTACCCFTPRQRLAWAIRHGVTPPESVHYTDEDWIAAANDVAPDSAHCSLCVADIKTKLDKTPCVAHVSAGSSCADASGQDGCDASADAASSSCCSTTPASSTPSLPFPSISPLTCKGLELLLAFALPSAPPLALSALLLPPPRLPSFGRPEDDRSPSRALETAPPPPRSLS